jgi:hypothetical protein
LKGKEFRSRKRFQVSRRKENLLEKEGEVSLISLSPWTAIGWGLRGEATSFPFKAEGM